MIISNAEDLRKYLPSSVYDDTDSLVVLTESAERKHLVPVLGEKLLNFVDKCIPFVIGGRVPGSLDPIPYDDKVIDAVGKLAELCQSAIAYATVADNAGQLSLSFNQGNGLAQVNTDGFTAASEDAFKRFINDVWHHAKQDIDDICYLMEKYSKEAPASKQSSSVTNYKYLNVLLTMKTYWQESEWFYLQGDLLLTTAKEARRYVTNSELPFSYAQFVDMQGELRTRQEANIAPELGSELLEALVKSQYDETVFTTTTAKTEKGKKNIKSTMHLLRMSLMSFVRWSRAKAADKQSHENDAKLFLFRAIENMQKMQDAYMPYIENSPVYVKERESVEVEDKYTGDHPTYGESEDGIFNPFGV